MPDPKRQTVSASQAAALWNQSPYVTAWQLHHWLAGNLATLDAPDDEIMEIARLSERPVVLELARRRLGLEIQYHDQDVYERHPTLPLGCTLDAEIRDPNRGTIVVEAKCVQERVFMRDWTDTAAPKHIEIQVQTQMLVKGAAHGVIAVLVGGYRFALYQRLPNADLHAALAARATDALERARTGREPDPFGAEIELPALRALYPEIDPDVTSHSDSARLEDAILNFLEAKDYVSTYSKIQAGARALILAEARGAGLLKTPRFEVWLKQTKSGQICIDVRDTTW